MIDKPKVFNNSKKAEIFYDNDCSVDFQKMTLSQLNHQKRQAHVDELSLMLCEEFGILEYVEVSHQLSKVLKLYDFDLFKIYNGKADLWGDYYFKDDDLVSGWCPMRNKLYHVTKRVLQWIGRNGGVEDLNETKTQDYIKKMLGWKLLITNKSNKRLSLPEHLLIKNWLQKFKDKASMGEFIIEHDIEIAQEEYYHWLYQSNPKLVSKLHQIMLEYFKKNQISKKKYHTFSIENRNEELYEEHGTNYELYPFLIDLYITKYNNKFIKKINIYRFWNSLFTFKN